MHVNAEECLEFAQDLQELLSVSEGFYLLDPSLAFSVCLLILTMLAKSRNAHFLVNLSQAVWLVGLFVFFSPFLLFFLVMHRNNQYLFLLPCFRIEGNFGLEQMPYALCIACS